MQILSIVYKQTVLGEISSVLPLYVLPMYVALLVRPAGRRVGDRATEVMKHQVKITSYTGQQLQRDKDIIVVSEVWRHRAEQWAKGFDSDL